MPQKLFYNPGASGYGILPGGRYGRTTGTEPTYRQDYGVYNPTLGKVVSILTGQPWTGVEPRTGITYSAGAPSAQSAATVNVPGVGPINPNDVSQRYRAVEVVKSPAVAGATANLMDTFTKTANESLVGLDDALKNFGADIGAARTATARASDIGGTEAALTGAQGRYSGALAGSQSAYEQALADAAARERAVVQQAQTGLTDYDRAIDAVRNQQLAQAYRQFAKYKIGTSTPYSPSGYDTAILAREAGRIAAPMELAKVQRRYDILSGMALPVEQAATARGISYAGSYLPTIAGAEYTSSTGTAQAIQALRNQVAGMTLDSAIRFMQSSGVPAGIMQAVLAGQTSNLANLAQLEDAAYYRGLQDVVGAYPSQPVGYNMSLPAYPEYPISYPNRYMPQAMPRQTNPIAPAQTTPGASPWGDTRSEQLYNLYGLSPADYASLGVTGDYRTPNYGMGVGTVTDSTYGYEGGSPIKYYYQTPYRS